MEPAQSRPARRVPADTPTRPAIMFPALGQADPLKRDRRPQDST
jgi:hypothetical protein